MIFRLHDHAGVDLAEAHADQAHQAHAGVGHVRLEPDLAIGESHNEQDQGDDDDDRADDERPDDVEGRGLAVAAELSEEGEEGHAVDL